MAKTRWNTRGRFGPEDAFALQALAPLGGGYLPWTGFALRPAAVMTVINEMMLYEARRVVELGVGLSTIMSGRFMRASGPEGGRIIGFDNDATWIEKIQRIVEREGLTDYIELVHAPSAPWAATKRDRRLAGDWAYELPAAWYDTEVLKGALSDGGVDFVLVDGPRGKRTINRFPALPELLPFLSEDPTIVLDDAKRPPEMEIIARWQAGLEFQFVTYDHSSLAVGRRP